MPRRITAAGLLVSVFLPGSLCQSSMPLLPLGGGDIINVSIEEEPDLTKRLTVSPAGKIEMPLLNAPLRVSGLTPAEAGTLIEEAYKRERLLIHPVAEVRPVEYHSYLVKVTGEANRPVEFQALEPVTLLSVLAKAGGPTTKASGEIEVTRHDRLTGEESTQIVSVRDLLENDDPKYNLTLRGGEEVHLPPAPVAPPK